MLLHYVVLSESDFLPLRYEYTIHTQIKPHTLQVLESALKRLSGLLPLAFEGCQTSDFHLVNQQTRPTKAENTSSVLGLEWKGKREGKWKRDRQAELLGLFKPEPFMVSSMKMASTSQSFLSPLSCSSFWLCCGENGKTDSIKGLGCN